MATDVIFPLYEILVNSIFGGVGIAIVIMGVILGIILLITRTSQSFILYWLLFYFITMITFYFGIIAIFSAAGIGIFLLVKNLAKGTAGGEA